MALEKTLHQYERILSLSSDAIAVLDRNYNYQFVNQTYLNWHKKTYEEMILNSVIQTVGEEAFAQKIKPELDKCLAGEKVQF